MFAYCSNNPVNGVDHNGLFPRPVMSDDFYETEQNRKVSIKYMKRAITISSKSIKKKNKGTFALGIGAVASFGIRAEVNGGLIVDRNGGAGAYLTVGFGGGFPALGGNLTLSYTNATHYYENSGVGAEMGGTYGFIGVDVISGQGLESPKGANVNIGPIIEPIFEGHGEVTYTKIWDIAPYLYPEYIGRNIGR